MDTAKIDVKKLQLLNDRINQTLDALTQVRLSVHGLSHASAGAQQGFGQQGIGQNPYQQNPFQSQGQNPFQSMGQTPFQVNPFAQQAGGFGLGHSTLGQGSPFGAQGMNPFQQFQNPYQQQQVNPYLLQLLASQGLSHTGIGVGAVNPWSQQSQNPWASMINPALLASQGIGQGIGTPQLFGGISHAGLESQGGIDPYVYAKIFQTFPYVQMPVPPGVSLY